MNKFKFIDLFSGIGGFHLAMHDLGGECVFASEIDSFARETYEYNFKKISPNLFETNSFNQDIRKVNPSELPEFDILCAGFPCQPFSQAGQKRGFQDVSDSERGNLFFYIADIIEEKKPKAFFLENVRGLLSHDKGNTFKVIKEILEDLGYNFFYKIVNASDYGLPQLRPRLFMIGFRSDLGISKFEFPPKEPLKFNMSDVWGGQCSREIGFTIRVGGRGSDINDRRNWDAYLVDGQVKKLMPPQAKKMQGFPDEFIFPCANTQAMKQLGNSVAIDAIKAISKQMLKSLSTVQKEASSMNETKNKGEWTELYTFFKILYEKKISLADKNLLEKLVLNVTSVTNLNMNNTYLIDGCSTDITKVNKKTNVKENIDIKSLLNEKIILQLRDAILNGVHTFNIDFIDNLKDVLGIVHVKGGNSTQKSDIVLDLVIDNLQTRNQGFGIKSYIGSPPTLLNASGNTNFIYKVMNLSTTCCDAINSELKLSKRIQMIYDFGGYLQFESLEKETMDYNLRSIDSNLPELLADMLVEFYHSRKNKIIDNLKSITMTSSNYHFDFAFYEMKIKNLLVAILLGMFAGKKWNGEYQANGTIVVKKNGDQVAFHICDFEELKSFLFENIKFDTPSPSRHKFGNVIKEKNGQLYLKLNLQLRF